jgi:glyoxylase-like metal-dependent hydrolase (beta-lactamase superfamily II)
VRELQPGLWHWTSPHPEWQPECWWPQEVSSYAIDDGGLLLLFDPLEVPVDLLELDRDPVIVLTAPWHERDAEKLVTRLGAPVYLPAPDRAEDLMRKYGITLEQAADGSPDAAWLVRGKDAEFHPIVAGDRLPFGIEVFPGREKNDVVFWVEDRRAVVTGDSLVDFGRGFEIAPESLTHGITREYVVENLRPLLDRDVEIVLPAHGAPQDRASFERALA